MRKAAHSLGARRSRGAGILQVLLGLVVAGVLVWLALKMFERARIPGSGPGLPSPRMVLDRVQLRVSGLESQADALTVQAAVQRVDGVAGVQVDFPSGRARITFNPSRTNPDQLMEAIRRAGFQATR